MNEITVELVYRLLGQKEIEKALLQEQLEKKIQQLEKEILELRNKNQAA